MSDQPQKPKQRRGFRVDGEEGKSAGYTRTKPRSLDEAFGIDREEPANAAELAPGLKRYDPKMVDAFLAGRVTLGDLEGITKQEQYEMAKVGHSFLTSGRLEKAKTIFTGLLALDPFDAYFHTVLGSIAQQEHRLKDADASYTKALGINPFSATAFANRGEVRVQLGRLDEGAEDLISAIEHDPNGAEQATLRARATLMVLREQLAGAELVELSRRANEATDSKVKAGAVPKGAPPSKAPLRAPPPPKASANRPSAKGGPPPRKK